MATKVTMPQLGETVVEGTILRWLKEEGEQIGRDEPLFEISTDKVDTEVPSPVGGTITKILVPEGETVSVGTELVEIDDGSSGEQTAEVSADGASAAGAEGAGPDEDKGADAGPEAGDSPAKGEARAEGDGDGGGRTADTGASGRSEEEAPAAQQGTPADEETREGAEREQPAAEEQREGEPGDDGSGAAQQRLPEPAGAGGDGDPARATAPAAQAAPGDEAGEGGPRSHILSPLVRRLAEENDIDLSQVRGTGTGGRITKRDITAYIESGPTAPAAPTPAPSTPEPAAAPAAPAEAPAPAAQPLPAPAAAAAGAREEAVPMTHIRKAIAKHMVGSLQTTARAWNLVEVNMEGVAQLRNRAKDAFKAREGISLTYLPFLSRAVCDALLAYPDVNGELRDDQIIRKQYVNLGIAVAYDEGLIVPVVKDADGMNLAGLARSLNDVAARARSKKLKPDEVHGGTFTITNPGPFGSIMSVPIINQPQCAILAFDTVEKRPVVIDDAIAIRHMVYLSMSWDHRIIDGATAAQFLGRLKKNLESWDFTPELQHYLP